jgi:N-acetylneuraminic acid mutarotase
MSITGLLESTRRIRPPRGGSMLLLAGLMTGAAITGVCPQPVAPASAATTDARWVPTGNLHTGRMYHTATLLPNGKVLVVGGAIDGSAELYDPATGTWSVVTGRSSAAHYGHTATLLPDGRVLIVGGVAVGAQRPVNSPNSPDNAELYDATTGTWTRAGSPFAYRSDHTATLLQSGKVLVAGGANDGIENSAALYDPATGTWSQTGSLTTQRAGHQATLLQDGRVLVTGGSNDGDFSFGLRNTEIYDPTAGTWSQASDLNVPRYGHSATLLSDGKVLVVGGDSLQSYIFGPRRPTPPSPPNNNSAELFDPATGNWSAVGTLNAGRSFHTASLLPSGEVMVVGGYTISPLAPDESIESAERYDPSSALWRNTSALGTARSGHTATLLPNGEVLVVGGFNGMVGSLNSAELYDSAVPPGTISPGFTGSWFNPAQNGHGFMLEVLSGTPMQLLASWFAFAPQGGQAWIVGLGPIDGNHAVLQGIQTAGTGARFPPNFDQANVRAENWGTLTFTFSDCNHGRVDWAASTPSYGSGGMDLTRLTLPAGLVCP